MKVVVDAGPIIALAKTGYLGLLPRLFNEVIIPERVMAEIASPGESRPGAELVTMTWARVQADPTGQQEVQRRRRLGEGEAEAIAIARHDTVGTYLLVDDQTAFKVAARFGVQTLRTGAVLVIAVDAGLVTIDAAKQALATLVSESYLSPAIERALIALIDELNAD